MHTTSPTQADLSAGERYVATVSVSPVQSELTQQLSDDPTSGMPTGAKLAGDYELLSLLGRGGMGVVYLARHHVLKRNVAYKVLTHLALPDPEAIDRFRSEATLLAKLQHPHIVQIFDSGTYEGVPFLAMEYVPGGSLARRLREQRPTPSEAAELIATIARAVGHAHSLGIIHRDLNPANILLTSDGQPKVVDFGLARDLGGERLTRTGLVAGTPLYMAPEQLVADESQTPAVDVWAIGVMLYEMLTGTVPFPGSDPQVILTNILRHEAVSLRAWQPTLPSDLETICLKCLQKDAHRRYATANELGDDLERFLDHRAILARPVGPWEKSSRWCRRNPTVAGLTCGIAIVLVASSMVSLLLARWAVGEQNRAIAAANAEASLRRQAELAFESERHARTAQTKALEEAEAIATMLDSLLGSVGPGRDTMAELRRRMDQAAASLRNDGRDPIVRGRLLYALAMTRRRLGDFGPAVDLMEQSYSLRAEHLGVNHPISRHTARELSYTYVHVGRGDDAIRVLKPVLDAELAAMPADSPNAIPILNAMMLAYSAAGRRDDEKAVGERIIAICQKHYGDDHESTHWVRVNIANHDRIGRRYDLVIPIFEKALVRFKSHCALNSSEVLWTQGQLGQCLLEAGRPEQAEPHLRASYEHDIAVLGPSHPFTINSSSCLAVAYERIGKHGDAVPLRRALLEHYRSLGENAAAEQNAKRLGDDIAAMPR
ncbi:MAG: serine/threonine-protein kinase [Gemmataceae bacterium]